MPFSLFSVNPHNNPQLHQTTLELLLKTRADNATLTARQYGEVVLPDAASGHDPDTLTRKLSRRAPREHCEQRGCKEGMARVFAVQVQNFVGITRVAVQV